MKAILPNNGVCGQTSSKKAVLHGYMIYACEHCGERFRMYLEEGVEEGESGIKRQPCPFIIQCPHCKNGLAKDISGLIPLPNKKSIDSYPDGTMYFAYDYSGHSNACGIVKTYKAIRKKKVKGDQLGLNITGYTFLDDWPKEETEENEETNEVKNHGDGSKENS